MSTSKLPLKMSIARLFRDNAPRDKHAVYAELEPHYGTERQFSHGMIENHLMSLKAVGILKTQDAHITPQNELVRAYVITSFGHSKLPR